MPITTGALALGSTIIGSGGGGDTSGIEDLINDYAKGRIICDTSTMQVGDTVRVRSVTTNEYTDKTVTIVGGYLVFNVLCKDYYKICMLQGGGHQITITGYDSESYVDIQIFDGMIGTGVRVYSSITSGAPNDYNGTGINLYFDSNSNKWVLKSTGTIVYQNQQYTSGQTIEEWSGQVNISLEEIPTEVGGEYVEIGFGDLHRSNVLDKNSLGGVQGILNAHQEGNILAIGDEVPIIHGGNPWIMQVGDIDTTNHAVHFVSKNIYSSASSHYDYTISNLRTAIQGFYTDISNEDKRYIKQVTRQVTYGAKAYDDYVWCLGRKEVDGINGIATQHQFPIFVTQANRIKTYNGTASAWWTADYSGGGSNNISVATTGAVSSDNYGSSFGVLPCFTLMADS